MTLYKRIILKSPVYATIEGDRIHRDYRMVLEYKQDHWIISPEQSFQGKFNQYSGLPGWRLDSFKLENIDYFFSYEKAKNSFIPNILAIDYGQEWFIHNVRPAIEEAFTIIKGELNENK